MVSSASFWLRYWCRKDKPFCERLFILHSQQSEKDSIMSTLLPGKISADAHGSAYCILEICALNKVYFTIFMRLDFPIIFMKNCGALLFTKYLNFFRARIYCFHAQLCDTKIFI